MACGDVLSLEDLQTAKKHQIFEAEVITGKAGGVPGGASIDYATNQVTGQTQKTMPAIMRDVGFEPAGFDFTSGGTLATSDRNKAVLWPLPSGDGGWYYWEGALPKVIPAGSTPASTGGVATGAWRPMGDAFLRTELASASGASLIGFQQSGAGAVLRTAQDKMRERLSFGDHSTLAQTITAASSTRDVDMAGQTATLSSTPANQFGARLINGKVLVPSLIAGFNTQINTYADDVNGLMIARENLAAWWLSVTAGKLQTVYLYGDSTVETGGSYPVKPHELFKQALLSAGVNNCQTINRGLSGTSWSDLNAIPDLGASTKLIVIKYGINDAVKANALTTFMADARSKLTAIRANINGSPTKLSILLMGPNSTYRPSTGQDAQWYEDLRNCYLQLCKEFDCAYFDTYAYLQQTKYAPGFWMDNIAGGEGIHPDPVAVYWIWREAIKTFVLGDGQWNLNKANQLWNPNNFTRVASAATPPSGFGYGVTIEAALIANGWPFDGVVVTTRHSDGIAVQNLYSQDVVPRTASRRGGGAVWTQWGGLTTAVSSFLNSWTNKAGGYTAVRYTVGADGFVELEGALTGGTIGVSAFQLPVNVRPASTKQFATAAAVGSAAMANVTIFADGNVIPFAASNATVSLDGIRFRVIGS